MPMYNFDPAEEQDDLLEQELLDHGRDGSLNGPNAKVGRAFFVSYLSASSCETLFGFVSLTTRRSVTAFVITTFQMTS